MVHLNKFLRCTPFKTYHLSKSDGILQKMDVDSSFHASTGWLHKFKSHHRTCRFDISDEKLNSDRAVVVGQKKI